MSDILDNWNAAKAAMHKEASKSKATLALIESAVGKAKGLPAPKGTSLAKMDDGLKAVEKNVETLGKHKGKPWENAKPVKGPARDVGPPVPSVTMPGYGAPHTPRPPMRTLKDHWNGLGDTTRGAIAGTAIAGTAGLGGHALGRSSGVADGLETGAASGYDAGLQAGAQQANTFDPGILGRLMEVFTGRSAAPIDTANAQMQAARQAAIQRILSGGVKSASAKKMLAAAGVGLAGGGAIGGSIEVFTGRQDTAKSLRDRNVERVIRGEIVNGKEVAK